MLLSKLRIKRKLGALSKDLSINIYKTIDSTNTQAKLHAEYGRCKNAIFIAKEQTAGRGRMGRSFISERGKGLYLTVLISKKLPASFATSLTTYMAVIAAEAIESLSGISVNIKWVNDLLVGGKKLAGILTEGRASDDGESLEYAAIGIGINLLKQSFDSEVSRIATTLEDECAKRIDAYTLAIEIVKRFFDSLDLVGSPEIADRYRSRSFLIGNSVTVIKAAGSYPALVEGITDRCELLIKREDGEIEILSTGEVSVRPSEQI